MHWSQGSSLSPHSFFHSHSNFGIHQHTLTPNLINFTCLVLISPPPLVPLISHCSCVFLLFLSHVLLSRPAGGDRSRPWIRHRHRCEPPRPHLHHYARLLRLRPRQVPQPPSHLRRWRRCSRLNTTCCRDGGGGGDGRGSGRDVLPEARAGGEQEAAEAQRGGPLLDMLGRVWSQGRDTVRPRVQPLLPRRLRRRMAQGQRHVPTVPELASSHAALGAGPPGHQPQVTLVGLSSFVLSRFRVMSYM